MFLSNLFKFNKKCSHEKIPPNLDFAYCPDCGKLIENEWYITRCACCGVKLKSINKNNDVVPENHYCSNCGSQEFVCEKLEKIDFININFAVLIKKEKESSSYKTTTQCWQEKTNAQPKLLGKCLLNQL